MPGIGLSAIPPFTGASSASGRSLINGAESSNSSLAAKRAQEFEGHQILPNLGTIEARSPSAYKDKPEVKLGIRVLQALVCHAETVDFLQTATV